MNAMQMLVRVADLIAEQRALPRDETVMRASVDAELRALLAEVGRPPAHLFDNSDPMAWSAAFVETFPQITNQHVFAWFAGAMGIGRADAERVAYEAGCQAQLQADQAFIKESAAVMNQLRDLVAAGLVRDVGLLDKATGEKIKLSDLINRGRRG